MNKAIKLAWFSLKKSDDSFFDSCVISIFTMLTISYSPIAKYDTKRKRVSYNMGLTFQITSKCKGHLATLTYKNAKKQV